MHADLERLLISCGHVCGATDLRALGLDHHDVYLLVTQGELVRLRRGAFVDGSVWRTSATWERHELRARAVLRALGPETAVALSHHSALAVHGIGVYGVDDRVHLCRTDDGRSRQDGLLVIHRRVPSEQLVEVRTGWSVTIALACAEVAAHFGVEAGLVSAEAALRERRTTRADLEGAARTLGAAKGCHAATRVAELASAKSESAGESRTRWLLLTLGYQPPQQQAEIADEHGLLVARVDFLFRAEKVIVEFDGMLKYTDPSALRREKVREDRLRELGYEVVRLTWADLDDPSLIARRLEAAFARARARRS